MGGAWPRRGFSKLFEHFMVAVLFKSIYHNRFFFVFLCMSTGHTQSEALADFGLVAVPKIVSRSHVDVTDCPQSSNHCVRTPGRW